MTSDDTREYNRIRSAKWREANREHYNAYKREQNKVKRVPKEVLADRQKNWRQANPEHYNAYQRGYYARNRDKIVAQSRARLYGISADDQAAMLAAQGGVCAICLRPETGISKHGLPKSMHLDHDHATGALRGFLCSPCNVILGHSKDDPAILRAAADYLDRHRKDQL